MKERLKKAFTAVYCSQTFELRTEDLRNNLPTASIKAQWPGLFSVDGVISFSAKTS